VLADGPTRMAKPWHMVAVVTQVGGIEPAFRFPGLAPAVKGVERGDAMKIKSIAAVLAVALSPLLAIPSATAQQHLDAAAVRGDLDELQYMYDGRFEATPFPGIYRMVRQPAPSPRATAPILMTRNADVTFNNGALGPQDGKTGRKLSVEEWGALVMRWRGALRFGDMLQFGGDGPLRMVVVSGFDCPYSKKLEMQLRAANARYVVAPSTIGTANQPRLRDIWCSADRSAAWSAAMERNVLPSRAPAACAYDADYFRTFAGMMGGSLPVVLFADGTISSGSNPAAILAKLAELNKNGVDF